MKKGLAPVIGKDCRVLILGSFPSEESLCKREYYADRTNDFWKVIGRVTCKDLFDSSYEYKVASIMDAGIGLWDVFAECEREGSSDSKIKKGILNDFHLLEKLAPHLDLICFNGKKAASYGEKIERLGNRVVSFYSSSGANRKYQTLRRSQWLGLRDLLK